LSAHAAEECRRAEKSVTYQLWHDLDQASFSWPSTWPPETTSEPAEPLAPRDYQATTIDKVVKGLAKGGRGQLNLPPGSGKTLVGLWSAEQLRAKRTLILLPSLTLVRQTLDVWATHSTTDFRFPAVCSDATTADQKDSWVVSAAELGHRATTDPTDIADFLQGTGRRVIFSTYQSSPRIAEAFKSTTLTPFDLVIADEAHRCAGKSGPDFAAVLDEAKLPASRRLFMTATPRILTGRAKAQAVEDKVEVASMDDEAVFGPVLHSMSFREAIERDILSDYQVVVLVIDADMEPTYRQLLSTYTCQICRVQLQASEGAYAEAAHIRPLGLGHNGPDKAENILCLCPNHHVQFDQGVLGIDNNYKLLGFAGELRMVTGHNPDPEHLAYHRSHIYNISEKTGT
jgi:predicted helicase